MRPRLRQTTAANAARCAFHQADVGSGRNGRRWERAPGSIRTTKAATQFKIGPGLSNQGWWSSSARRGRRLSEIPNSYEQASLGRDREDRIRAMRVVQLTYEPLRAGRRPSPDLGPQRRAGQRSAPPMTAAALAISDTPTAVGCWRYRRRLDATTIRAVWDAGAACARRSTHASRDRRCSGRRLLRRRGHRAPGRSDRPSACRPGRGREPESRVRGRCLSSSIPRGSSTISTPSPPRRPAIEEIGRTAAGIWRDMRNQVIFIGETVAALGAAVMHPFSRRSAGATSGGSASGSAPTRLPIVALDLVPAGRDPRVPVGGADEAVRRRDLRRRPDRAVDAARARAR